MKRGLLAALAAAALSLTGCFDGNFGGFTFRESVDLSKPLAATGELAVENTNGSVHVATWSEPRVRIEAVKAAGSESALRALTVDVNGDENRLEVRSRMPRGPWFGRGGKVDYTITVPRSARVSVRTVNGRVEVVDVDGAVHAQTVNGTVEADGIGGEVEANTVNGTVNVRMARVPAGSRNRLEATNGTVRITLPRDASGEIDASTVNGAVRCDFDVRDGRVSRRRVEGRIGEGTGARFELHTVNGTATIDRGLSSGPATADRRPEAEEAPRPGR